MGHGTIKIIFKRKDGAECPLTIDNDLATTLDRAKIRNRKNFDYVAVIAGYVGDGKSTLARTMAAYCCPWFSLKYVCFTAEEFIEVTSKCPEYSSIILDESFISLNSRVQFNPDFQKIVNHLSIIRKRKLFIFLLLPNFFDLSKSVALFRANHLYVPYSDVNDNRGSFSAFDRVAKQRLYVKGSKFAEYMASPPNFHGRFFKNVGLINEINYEHKKDLFIEAQNLKIENPRKERYDRNEVMAQLYEEYKLTQVQIGVLFKITSEAVSLAIKSFKKARDARQRVDRNAKN